jgi:signal transduction histidine kinase
MMRAFRSSLVGQIAAAGFLLFVMYSLFLGLSSYMTGQLIGITTAIGQAEAERMAIYRLASLVLRLSEGHRPDRLRELMTQEMSHCENILNGLRHGSEDHPPVGDLEPTVVGHLQGLQKQWDKEVRPSIESAMNASGNSLEEAQQAYVRHADEFVEALSVMIHTLKERAAARTKTLYGLQILFLLLSAAWLGGVLVLLHYRIRRPLDELTRGAERLAAGVLNVEIAAQSSDELERLARPIQQMAARLFDAAQPESHLLRARLHAIERKVAELTHEVKAPAGRVAEFAGWIEKDYGDRLDAKALRYLTWIKKEGRDLAELAERTLDLVRMTAVPTIFENVDTQAVVKEVVDLLGPQAQAARVEFSVAQDLPPLACRRIHLKQVLENLISNAIKYVGAQQSPRVEIGWEPSAQGPVIYVADNGMGIEPAMTERIFDPFQRLCAADIPGAGIGLSLVKTIVQQYDGTVWVDSKPGEGSRFYVRLPIPTDRSTDQGRAATPLLPTSKRN